MVIGCSETTEGLVGNDNHYQLVVQYLKLTTLNVVSPVASISLLIGSDVHHFVFTVKDNTNADGLSRQSLPNTPPSEERGGIRVDRL